MKLLSKLRYTAAIKGDLDMDKSIIMNLSLDELEVISESLDLLRNGFKVDITVGKINIQDIIERVDRAIDKIE